MAPIPKRSSERIRRNKVAPVTTIHAAGPVEVPPLGIENPHPLTEAFWVSLHESAQSKFYEPSDWWLARVTADELNLYFQGRRSAMKQAEITKWLGLLLVSEVDRRRLHLEVERAQEVVVKPVGASASYKRAFGMEAV